MKLRCGLSNIICLFPTVLRFTPMEMTDMPLSAPICLGAALREAAISGIDTATESWLINALDKWIDIPEPDHLDDYSGQFKLRLPKSLYRQLAINSKKEGISMNQYCLYLLVLNDALHCPMTLSTKQREIIANGLHTPLENCRLKNRYSSSIKQKPGSCCSPEM